MTPTEPATPEFMRKMFRTGIVVELAYVCLGLFCIATWVFDTSNASWSFPWTLAHIFISMMVGRSIARVWAFATRLDEIEALKKRLAQLPKKED